MPGTELHAYKLNELCIEKMNQWNLKLIHLNQFNLDQFANLLQVSFSLRVVQLHPIDNKF